MSGFFLQSCSLEEDSLQINADKELIDTGNYSYDMTPDCPFSAKVPQGNSAGCWEEDFHVSIDCHYNLLFTRYGNGWTGGDATYSIDLADGRILWLFGDTFLGTVHGDRSREGGKLIRNTFVVQQGDELVTMYKGTPEAPQAYISPLNSNEWYWPLDGTVINGELQLLLGRFGTDGTGGMWDFHYVGIDMASISLPDLVVKDIKPVQESGEISYGSCVLEDDAYIYIYGITTVWLNKFAHVARSPGGDLKNEWEYFDGQNWISEPSSYPIHSGVSDQFSVIRDNGKYYLITHKIIFGGEILIFESDAPEGPWSNERTLYCTPESGGNIFTYNSFVHPELSETGELRISYNINSFEFSDLFENADNYRPKFVHIENWR
jgi:hypothetical protein